MFFMVLSPDLGPKMAQHAPKIAPRWPQDRPESPQDGPKTAQHGPKTGQEGSKTRRSRKTSAKPCNLRVEIDPPVARLRADRGRPGGIGEAFWGDFRGGGDKSEFYDLNAESHTPRTLPRGGAGGFKRFAHSAVTFPCLGLL